MEAVFQKYVEQKREDLCLDSQFGFSSHSLTIIHLFYNSQSFDHTIGMHIWHVVV